MQGELRLSFPPAFEPFWHLLNSFQKQFPQIQIHCLVHERLVNLIADGIDVAVHFGELHGDQFIAKSFGQAHGILVASPKLIEQVGIPKHPFELTQFPCAMWKNSPEQIHFRQLGNQKIFPSTVFSSNDIMQLRHST